MQVTLLSAYYYFTPGRQRVSQHAPASIPNESDCLKTGCLPQFFLDPPRSIWLFLAMLPTIDLDMPNRLAGSLCFACSFSVRAC
jgi:hypothetical protein